jgi:peptidoglycan hydrolase CwlO-like protein
LKTTRADLSEAQRSRTDLQDQLNRLNIEAEKLRKKSNRDGRRLDTLESEKAILGKRLKDRDEELREKTKLLEVGDSIS